MTSARRSLVWILLCASISIFWGNSIGHKTADGFVDFRAVYYGARCLLSGHNPYNVGELSAFYKSEGGEHPLETALSIRTVTLYVNLPTTLVLAIPFALLPLALAHTFWFALTAGLFILSAALVWRLGTRYSPEVSFALILIFVANDEVAFAGGNTAGIVVGLCIIAVWCFVEDRLPLIGILCLVVSLALKPHDVGLVWLYFLLAGGVYRRRALQSLGFAAALGLGAVLWLSHVAPHWIYDWHTNLATIAAPGGLNEPGPFSVTGSNAGMVLSLQSTFSILWNSPSIYNAASYLICGPLLLIWFLRTVTLKPSRQNIWLGLAAVSTPSLLITYHRCYDAKLLLLTIPACAMLWSKRDKTARFALLFTSAAIVFTADLPLTILVIVRSHIPFSTNGIFARVFSAVCYEPTPLVLLAMGIFYLWVYVKAGAASTERVESREPQSELPGVSAASFAVLTHGRT